METLMKRERFGVVCTLAVGIALVGLLPAGAKTERPPEVLVLAVTNLEALQGQDPLNTMLALFRPEEALQEVLGEKYAVYRTYEGEAAVRLELLSWKVTVRECETEAGTRLQEGGLEVFYRLHAGRRSVTPEQPYRAKLRLTVVGAAQEVPTVLAPILRDYPPETRRRILRYRRLVELMQRDFSAEVAGRLAAAMMR
jgi:hypothetical protein